MRSLRRAAAASATTAALVLLAPSAVVAFVVTPGASSLWPPASPDGSQFCSLNGCASRGPPTSSSSGRRVASIRENGGRSRGRSGRGRGVASLRAEVLPEGGVSPCIIKVSDPVCCGLSAVYVCSMQGSAPSLSAGRAKVCSDKAS